MPIRYLNLTMALLCAAAGTAHAVSFSESGDAGQLIGDAQSIGIGFDGLAGQLSPLTDVDVFRLELGAGLFTATVTSGNFFNALVLFDAAGRGLRADDDSGGGVLPINAKITETLSTGVYYLAIFSTEHYSSPTSAGGDIWTNITGDANTTPDGPGAASQWTGWQPVSTTTIGSFNYTIALNQTTVAVSVPEPNVLALTGGGLALMALRRRRQD